MNENRLPVVDTRLRPDARLYSETRIATSRDVAFLLAKTIQKTKEEFIGILNLNNPGQVVSFDIASPEIINGHFREVMTNTVLSNATNFVIMSNLRDWEAAKEVSMKFRDAGGLLEHTLLDHVWADSTGSIHSFSEMGWPLSSGDIYRDHAEVGYGATNQEICIHNNLNLIEERYFEWHDEITKDVAVDLLADDLKYRDRENLCVISLDEKGMPINCGFVSTGTIKANYASSKEVLKIPLLSKASSIVIMHNHPSGSTRLSHEDREVTAAIAGAANMVGIKVEDHIIIGCMTGERYSMKKKGDFMRTEENYGQLMKPIKKNAREGNAMETKGDTETGLSFKEDGAATRFTQTLINHLENNGYTLEVHDGRLLMADTESSEPFWEETSLEEARVTICGWIEEDMKKNGGMDALKEELEFLRGYDIDDDAIGMVHEKLGRKPEMDMRNPPAFKQERLPEQRDADLFAGNDLQTERTIEI